jgi:hypothetical protein
MTASHPARHSRPVCTVSTRVLTYCLHRSPDSDLTLIDELPYAPGLLAQAPDDLRERLAAAFGMQAVYRQDTRQATIVLAITDTTPAIIDAIRADPRIDHDTDNPPASHDTSVDVTRSPITTQTDEESGPAWLERRRIG